MKTAGTDVKMTDELERKLIGREVEGRHGDYDSAYLLPIVVGMLLLLGMLTLGIDVG